MKFVKDRYNHLRGTFPFIILSLFVISCFSSFTPLGVNNIIKQQNYDVGKIIILNRMHVLNNKIDKSWLNLSLNSYKVKFKELFLKNGSLNLITTADDLTKINNNKDYAK